MTLNKNARAFNGNENYEKNNQNSRLTGYRETNSQQNLSKPQTNNNYNSNSSYNNNNTSYNNNNNFNSRSRLSNQDWDESIDIETRDTDSIRSQDNNSRTKRNPRLYTFFDYMKKSKPLQQQPQPTYDQQPPQRLDTDRRNNNRSLSEIDNQVGYYRIRPQAQLNNQLNQQLSQPLNHQLNQQFIVPSVYSSAPAIAPVAPVIVTPMPISSGFGGFPTTTVRRKPQPRPQPKPKAEVKTKTIVLESDPEEEIVHVIHKPKPKPKQTSQVIYVEDSDDDELAARSNDVVYVQERQPQQIVYAKSPRQSKKVVYVNSAAPKSQVVYREPQESEVQYVYQNEPSVEYVYQNDSNVVYYDDPQPSENVVYVDNYPKVQSQRYVYR